MSNIKKKDTVMVIAGKDKGKTGEVRKVMPEKGRLVVAGINLVSKHARASQGKPGGIQKIEAPINTSNVALVCPKCKKQNRPKAGKLENGEKIRICRKCGETIL